MLMGSDVEVHNNLQNMVTRHEAVLMEEKYDGSKIQKRRNDETPGYSAIISYASAVEQFIEFLEWHKIWVGITREQMADVKTRTTSVKNDCAKKV